MKNRRKTKIRQGAGDTTLDIVVSILTVLLIIVTVYPLIYIFSMSISDPYSAARGEVFFLPKGISFLAYEKVLANKEIFMYYGNTIWYTVVGTLCGVGTTVLAAFPLSRREFRAKTPISLMITLTMFLGAGLIPNYIVIVKFLHLYNSRWALVLPGLTSAWYVIVTRSFFLSLPEELFDSAKMDGASVFRIFGNIALPLSKPIISVLAVYFGIACWNSYFSAMIYLSKKELQPLALYVRRIAIQNSMEEIETLTAQALLSQMQIKYVVIVVAVVPLLLLYPFFSKYMKKGLMVGSLKG